MGLLYIDILESKSPLYSPAIRESQVNHNGHLYYSLLGYYRIQTIDMRGQRDADTFLRFAAKHCSCISSGRTIWEVAKRFIAKPLVTKRTVYRLVQQYKQTQDLTKVGTLGCAVPEA